MLPNRFTASNGATPSNCCTEDHVSCYNTVQRADEIHQHSRAIIIARSQRAFPWMVSPITNARFTYCQEQTASEITTNVHAINIIIQHNSIQRHTKNCAACSWAHSIALITYIEEHGWSRRMLQWRRHWHFHAEAWGNVCKSWQYHHCWKRISTQHVCPRSSHMWIRAAHDAHRCVCNRVTYIKSRLHSICSSEGQFKRSSLYTASCKHGSVRSNQLSTSQI